MDNTPQEYYIEIKKGEQKTHCCMGQTKCIINDENRQRPIEIAIWYPTMSKNVTNEGIVWALPDVVVEGAIENTKCPLVLLSHGWGGEKNEQMWLAKTLVNHGFIVAAIDHYGNTWKNYSEEISLDFRHRPLDISKTLDYLTQESPFAELIDHSRIGFAGFSMGGLTGLYLAGGEINSKTYKDSRIQGFFLMAPRGKDFSASSLQSISVPLYIVVGEKDEVLPIEQNGTFISKNVRQNTLKILPGKVGHSIFLNCPTELGRKRLSKEIIEDEPSVDRDALHQDVSKMAVDFFSSEM